MEETSRGRVLMGTLVSLTAQHSDGLEAVTQAIEAAFGAMQRVDILMHPCRIGSDLQRLHTAEPGVPVTLHPWTMACLKAAMNIHSASGGRFDAVLPGSGASSAEVELGDMTVTRHAALQIDLGGIAKGFAVDRAIEILQQAGCLNGFVNAGGDQRGFGKPWPVEIRMASRRLQMSLNNEALAVSDRTIANHPSEHRGYYRHGAQIPFPVAVAISAREAMYADALTKVLDDCAESAHVHSLFAKFDARIVSIERRQSG